jgi:uncharacterized protein YjeT (DUF2065 family)
MQSTNAAPISKGRLWTGRIITAFVALFLIFDGVIHILKPAPVAEAFTQLGYPLSTSVGLGVLELGCLALYLIPRTSILGAILLTGYLGGATATQLRVGAGLFNLLFPALLGVLLWGALVLRDDRLRTFIPLREDRA